MLSLLFFFFFNDTATTEIYTLSLHDALPIFGQLHLHFERGRQRLSRRQQVLQGDGVKVDLSGERSEEHTSELQSRSDLVCRLLLEKKKKLAGMAQLLPWCCPPTRHQRHTCTR